VLHRSKDGKNEKTFDALEWLAAMCSHVPNKGEQMVRYYGYYSNVCRGQRKKANEDGLVPSILQPDESSKGYRKNWKVISAFFRSKRRLSVNLGLDPPCVPSGLYQPGTPPSTEILWCPTWCAKFALDTQGCNPLYSVPVKPSSYHLTLTTPA